MKSMRIAIFIFVATVSFFQVDSSDRDRENSYKIYNRFSSHNQRVLDTFVPHAFDKIICIKVQNIFINLYNSLFTLFLPFLQVTTLNAVDGVAVGVVKNF